MNDPVYEYSDGSLIKLSDIIKHNADYDLLSPEDVEAVKNLKVGQTYTIEQGEFLTRKW